MGVVASVVAELVVVVLLESVVPDVVPVSLHAVKLMATAAAAQKLKNLLFIIIFLF
jgi:hypothetical protein